MEDGLEDDLVAESARTLASKGASRGGQVRAEKLSVERRREIGINAAEKRWQKSLPKATHTGTLAIGDGQIECAVLDDGTRLLTQEGFLSTIGRSRKAKAGTGSRAMVASGHDMSMPPFLAAKNLEPFVDQALKEACQPVVFRNPQGGKAYGYRADLLPRVCEVYLMLRDEGKPTKEQQRIIFQCDILTRSLAKVGITALVDEATGYQFDRQRDELQQILAAYVAEELRPWVRAFPEEFFKQVHRIYDWSYPPKGAKHPRYMGKFINKYIYDRLPPGVHEELRNRNPSDEKGYRKHKHHQFLTDETGVSHLDRQIVQVVTVLKVSKTKEDFEANAKRLFDEDEPTLF